MVLGKVSSSMMGTFGALLEIILILYLFCRVILECLHNIPKCELMGTIPVSSHLFNTFIDHS